MFFRIILVLILLFSNLVTGAHIQTWNMELESAIPFGGTNERQSTVLPLDNGIDIIMANYFSLFALHCSPNEGYHVISQYIWDDDPVILDIARSGNYVFSLIQEKGIYVIDISDLEVMLEVDLIELNPIRLHRENFGIFVYEDLMLVTYQPNERNVFNRTLLFNIADPENIELEFEIELDFILPYAFNSDFLFCVDEVDGDEILKIFPLQAQPQRNQLLEIELPDITGLIEDNNHLVVTGHGANTFHYAENEWSQGVSIGVEDSRFSQVSLSGDQLLIVGRLNRWDVRSDLLFYDVSDWNEPQLISATRSSGNFITSHDQYIYTSYKWRCSAYQYVIAEDQITNTNYIGFRSSHYRDIILSDEMLLYAGGGVWDVTDPGDPHCIANYSGGFRQIIHGDYLICGTVAFDFSTGYVWTNSTEIINRELQDFNLINTLYPLGMKVYDNRLLVVDDRFSGRWCVYDIEDPENIPEELIRPPIPVNRGLHMGQNMVRIGDYVYTAISEFEEFCNVLGDHPEFIVWDINEWRDAEIVARTEFNGEVIDEHQGFVLASIFPGHGLAWWNVENPEEPVIEHECELPENHYMNNFKLQGNLLYALQDWGLDIYDIHEPGTANLVGYAHINPEYRDSIQYHERFGRDYFDVQGETVVVPLYGIEIFTYTGGEGIEGVAEIPLADGWSMVSSHIDPSNPDIRNMFHPLVERGELILLKDFLGRFYNPEFNFNNIPGWDVNQGYQVKMDTEGILRIPGALVDPESPISLPEGWSMAAYFPEEEVEAPDAFASIADQLLFAKDGEGHFYAPEQNFNNIPPLHRGAGYQVKVSEEVELVWNIEGEELASIGHERKTPSHFTPLNPTDKNMSILVTDLVGEGEIGAFTASGICVGATAFRNQNAVGLAVWGDDESTDELDGLKEGEAFTLKLWSSSLGAEFDLEPENILTGYTGLSGSGLVYETDGFTFFAAKALLSIPDQYYLSQNYPNPFNSTTILPYGLPETSRLSICIYDIAGRMVKMLVDDEVEAGNHTAIWDASTVSTGVYLVKLETESFSSVRKVILVR